MTSPYPFAAACFCFLVLPTVLCGASSLLVLFPPFFHNLDPGSGTTSNTKNSEPYDDNWMKRENHCPE